MIWIFISFAIFIYYLILGGLHKYLENDRKVLSFNVYWNDTSLEGGLNFYILNLFLADDTMEIKEVRTNNSGKDPFPLLLNR